MDLSPAKLDPVGVSSKMDSSPVKMDSSPVKMDSNRASPRIDTSPARVIPESPQVSEHRAGFKKPSNDTSRRNYRRHSPSTSRSLSPPRSGGWKRDRSPLSLNSEEDRRSKMADSAKRGRRSETGRGPDREYESNRGWRADALYSNRRSEFQNRDSYRSSDGNHGRRHSSYYDYSSHTHSNSSRASYVSEYSRRDEYGRRGHRDRDYDEHRRSAISEADRYPRERGKVNIRDKDELKKVQEKYKDTSLHKDDYKDMEGSLQREKHQGGKPDDDFDMCYSREKGKDRRSKGDEKDRGKDYEYRDDLYERDRRRERDDRHGRDRHRDRYESRDHDWHEDLPDVREHDQCRRKEPSISKEKDEKKRDLGGHKDEYNQRGAARKNDDTEDHKSSARNGSKSSLRKERGSEHSRNKGSSLDRSYGDYSAQEREVAPSSSHGTCRVEKDSVDKNSRSFNLPAPDTHKRSKNTITNESQEAEVKAHNSDLDSAGGKLEKSTKWGPEAQLPSDLALPAEGANDMNAARVAAMRAAELVNKNLGAGGFLSADQKKKLLWGSKKSTVEQPQEAATGTNRWDMARFSDPDRQEKFNKLMGVKGELKVNQQTGQKENGLFTTQKQMELQQDLEKQFTAGMRRRDGRTVGLGL